MWDLNFLVCHSFERVLSFVVFLNEILIFEKNKKKVLLKMVKLLIETVYTIAVIEDEYFIPYVCLF